MVDPFTIFQTGVAIGNLAQLLNHIRKYCRKLSNAPKEIEWVLASLDDDFNLTLLAIKRALDERSKQAVSGTSQIEKILLQGLTQAAKKCKDALTSIEEILAQFMNEDGDITVKGFERKKFVDMAPDIEKYMIQLDRFKSSLSLTLEVLTWYDQTHNFAITLSRLKSFGTAIDAVDIPRLFSTVHSPDQAGETTRRGNDHSHVCPTSSSLPISNTDHYQDAILRTESEGPGRGSPVHSPVADSPRAQCTCEAQPTPAPDARRNAKAISRGQAGVTDKDIAAFFDAVEGSHEVVVESLLSTVMDVNTVGERGTTALHLAAKANNLPMTKLLLRHTADVNAKDGQDHTALSLATKEGHGDIVSALLTLRRDDIDTTTRHDNNGTLLHYAVIHEDPTCSELLLDFKQSLVNVKDRSDQTPLHYAADKMRVHHAALLLRRGAEANEVDARGRTPMYLALESHDSWSYDMLQLLERYGGKTGRLPLMAKQKWIWEDYKTKSHRPTNMEGRRRATVNASTPRPAPGVPDGEASETNDSRLRARRSSLV